MRKTIFVLSIVLFFVNCTGKEPVFRGVHWNMGPSEVTNMEGKTPESFFLDEDGTGMISYMVELESIPGILTYEYEDGQLERINLEFEGSYETGSLTNYKPKYDRVKSYIFKEFGESYTNSVIDESLYSGYHAFWKEADNSNIKLQLDEYNGGMIYFAVNFSRP